MVGAASLWRSLEKSAVPQTKCAQSSMWTATQRCWAVFFPKWSWQWQHLAMYRACAHRGLSHFVVAAHTIEPWIASSRLIFSQRGLVLVLRGFNDARAPNLSSGLCLRKRRICYVLSHWPFPITHPTFGFDCREDTFNSMPVVSNVFFSSSSSCG